MATEGLVMEEAKRSSASVMVGIALFCAFQAQAAPFDEQLKPPRAGTSQALQTRLEAHFATFQRKQQEQDPAAFIRDRRAYQQWSDVYFAVTLALDEGTPLGDLSRFGLMELPDGKYRIDLRAFPQWEPLDTRLRMFSNPAVLESYLPALEARGFRASDVQAMRTYTATHDPRLAVHAEGRQLVDTFAQRLQKQRLAGRQLDLQEVLAYRYQKASIKAEAGRQWALGLLDTLDPQRQRILVSLLDESEADLTLGRTTEPFARTLEAEARPIMSGEYVQTLTSEEAQIRQSVARRIGQLEEGEQK
jgi:hypothetical protein